MAASRSWGKHYGCATRRSKGTCDNHHRIRREELEHRMLEGLKDRLLAPELVEEFARAYQEEVNRRAAERPQSRAQDEVVSARSSARSRR